MPELPEVESARSVIERAGLGRVIADVDDSDAYVCRPHRRGEIRDALVGRRLEAAHRRGKSMWCDVSADGPTLGIHLGMSGKIVIASDDGDEIDGGDYWEGRRLPGDYRWARFALTFSDGGRLMLVDPRRLGRVRLDPPVELLGPDATTITASEFRAVVNGRSAPVKARLMEQHRIAGVGNLLADEILWQAKINPARPVDEVTPRETGRLFKAVHTAVDAAIAGGGVHTLPIVAHRHAGGRCPRDGAGMVQGKVGGRTTWWCPKDQR
jgi:formamidopyrimidine-DNA glycosylase